MRIFAIIAVRTLLSKSSAKTFATSTRSSNALKIAKVSGQATKGSERAKEVDALSHDLLSQKKRADELIERYDFIRNIMNMPKTIISGSPPHCRWRCGKTGGTMEEHEPASEYMSEANKDGLNWMQTGGTTNDRGSTSRPVLDKSFGQSHEIFRVQWTTPQTSRGSIFLSSPRQNITFCTREDMPGPSPPPGDKRTSSFSRNPGQHRNETAERGTVQPNTFDLCLPNHKPAYVVGWSISCHWPGTGSTMPSMDVDHPSKYILSDRLTIPLDRSRSAQWQCTVFYVKQSEYNFPDLFNRRRESLQPDKKPNWFHRIFRSSKYGSLYATRVPCQQYAELNVN
ncbi:hypothetical protein B0H13DRAFT_895614 [Mycena leptocephala]|nr:hypothetical protein B0H13DRAFT_895614 [Mycena leptocephala]